MATRLAELGVHVVGVPKTIDNDLAATDFTFGFDTAVNIAIEAIDRLHTTAESHHRALVVEVMGRHAGWIALHAGIAGGANVVLIPERPFDIEEVCALVEHRFETAVRADRRRLRGRGAARRATHGDAGQGETDAFGHVRLGGIGAALAGEIEERTGQEARAMVLGHVQRGGTPTAFDRVLATRFGLHAVDAVHDGRVRHDGRAARHRHRPGAADRRRPASSSWCRRSGTPRRRSSSAERPALTPPGDDDVGSSAGCRRAVRVAVRP